MKSIITLLILLFSLPLLAQEAGTIKGKIYTPDNKPLPQATVFLFGTGMKDTMKTVSNQEGRFTFLRVPKGKSTLYISHIGYLQLIQPVQLTEDQQVVELNDLKILSGENLMQGITLESNKVQIKEDTVSFLIDSTMYRKNDNVEEVLKKLPGVQVDKDGTVTAQGKQVTKVKVNGKEFFGGDVTTATRELNADMVDKIQVIDDYGDQSAFTGIKDGDPSKTLNIQLKKDKNKGYFGNITAGAGTQERYLTSLSVNRFNNNQQISLIGNLNNTNASTFNFGNMGGGAMGSMVGGVVRSMGIGRGGSNLSSIPGMSGFGTNDGISKTQSIGLNYRDEWGSGLSANGSYSFSRRGTRTLKQITQQNFFQNNSNTNIQDNDDYTLADNHRFSFNIEYTIDSFNYIKFSPSVTYNRTNFDKQSNFSFIDNAGAKNNDGATTENSFSESPNVNANLLFNHRFAKRGRSLSLNLSAGQNTTDAESYYDYESTFFLPNNNVLDTSQYQYIVQDNKNYNYGVRASYIEPINKKRSLEFNYSFNQQFTGNDKKTFETDMVGNKSEYVDSLSAIFENIYVTNRVGVNFRTTEKKYNYTIGLAVQPASIQSNSVTGKYSYKQNLVNYFPVIRFAYNFSRSRSFNINYNGSTNQPTFSQLQPVYDYSNPQFITVGNPNLKPEFNNILSLRYNNFDFISGNVFFGNLSFSMTQDKIVTNTIYKGFGLQETQYLNTNGYFTAFGFYNFSKPFQNRKYVINLGGNLTYNNNVSYINGDKNKGKNWLAGQRLAADIKIKKWLETTLGVNYNLNSTKYSLSDELNANTTTWGLFHSARLFFPKNFRFNYDVDKVINIGYADNVNTDPLIINATLEKDFLKKQNLTVRLQAFDILNENTSVNRTVTGSSITDTRTNRLGRYLMLSVVFRLNKFNSATQSNPMMPGMPGGSGNMQMMIR